MGARLKRWLQARQGGQAWRWVLLAILGLSILLIPIPGSAAAPQERVFRVEASQFAYSPAVLKVNRGDVVTIELVALDVVHGLAVDGYDVETNADPGKLSSLTFQADRQGSFRFRCTETCGNMHPFMIGKLQVGQNELLWRAGLLATLVLLAGVWRGTR